MRTTMMTIIVLLPSIISVILSSLAIIDAPILLTNDDISKSFNQTSFPQGFIFGTASSAYQYEGAENVCGRGPSIWDNSTHKYPGINGGKEKLAEELVCQESPTEIGKCIRLLLPEDIIYFLKGYKGNSSLRVMEWKAYSSQQLPSSFNTWTLNLTMDFMSPMLGELISGINVADDSYNSLSLYNANALWRLVGLVSSVVGLLCYAQSPSFNRLIGRWNIVKFSLYGLFSFAIFTTILFVKKFSPSTRYAQIKTYTSFAVLMIISVYSFYYDKALNGKPEILSIVSNAAFALMSLSLSKLIKFGFEIGIFAYFLGCLVVQLWTINWMLILVAIIFGCPLFVMHSSSHSQDEVDTDQIIDESSGSDPEVGNAGQPDVGNESQVIIDSYPDYQQEVSSES